VDLAFKERITPADAGELILESTNFRAGERIRKAVN